MSAISATSRTCKTMADGTLRLTVDIEPNSAQMAFQLFGMPDVPIALARLTQDASIQAKQSETIDSEKPKGGALAKLAGQWCSYGTFFDFIRPVYDRLMGGDGSGYGDIDFIGEGMKKSEFCRHAILVICNVESRAELDHDPIAAEAFHRLIRLPYSQYLKGSA